MKRIIALIVIGFAIQRGAIAATNPSITLTDTECAKLVVLVHDDTEAGALFARIQRGADEALSAKPNPIKLLQTQGRLAGDPIKERTWKSIEDTYKLQNLGYAWAGTKKQVYADKIREFLLAWAGTNHSEGDPIDDTNLEGLLIAYDLTRATMAADDRQIIDAYLHEVAQEEIRTGESPAHTSVNNWNSHRLKIVGLIAFILHDPALIRHTVEAYQLHIERNLLPDGSSIDFHERDALHYQEYDLTPLLTLAIAARNNGIDLYDFRAPSGSSLAGGVAFMVPYANGTLKHPEFVHSTVPLDRKRAENGQAEYKSGTVWDPRNGLPTLDRAEMFDGSLLGVVIHLTGSKAIRFPSWQSVLNEVNQ